MSQGLLCPSTIAPDAVGVAPRVDLHVELRDHFTTWKPMHRRPQTTKTTPPLLMVAGSTAVSPHGAPR